MVLKMRYVIDTHVLIWYIENKLPRRIERILESAEKGESTIFVPTIVLAECLNIVNNDKIDLDFPSLLNRIKMEKKFIPANLDMEILRLLPIMEGEIHDRIIVATTKMLNATLITKDREVKRAGIIQVVW